MWKSAYHLFVLNGLIYLVTLLLYSLFLVISVPQIGYIKEPIFSYFYSVNYIKHMIHIYGIMYKNVNFRAIQRFMFSSDSGCLGIPS